jgi:hypothetical protein
MFCPYIGREIDYMNVEYMKFHVNRFCASCNKACSARMNVATKHNSFDEGKGFD